MLEVMEFIFQDFWHWLGTAILLYDFCSYGQRKEDDHETAKND